MGARRWRPRRRGRRAPRRELDEGDPESQETLSCLESLLGLGDEDASLPKLQKLDLGSIQAQLLLFYTKMQVIVFDFLHSIPWLSQSSLKNIKI